MIAVVLCGCQDPKLEELKRARDEVCKCKDATCFQKKAMDFSMKMQGKQPNMGSPKVMAAMQRMAGCAQKLQQP